MRISKFFFRALILLLIISIAIPNVSMLPALAEDDDDTAIAVNVTVNTGVGRKLISPYVYGINDTADVSSVTVKAVKQGGIEYSTYNWEQNFANMGADRFNTASNGLALEFTPAQQRQFGVVVQRLVNKSLKFGGAFSLTTLPMLGYVSADGNGPILDDQIAPSNRWNKLEMQKDSPLSLTPNLDDGIVYIDEYINFLTDKYGKSGSTGGIKAYALDNEPGMWSVNQETAHPDPTTIEELMSKSLELSAEIKDLDEKALVFGGGFAGMDSYVSLNNAPDWITVKRGFSWFIDYYLNEMKKASQLASRRLLDVLDIHYYSQDKADGCVAVSECEDYTHESCNKVRMQSPRTLWDNTYVENSSIGEIQTQFLPLIPTLQASINRHYSGTKMSVSEYGFGGGGHISGAIAMVDALGIFSREGVYFAAINTLNQTNKQVSYFNAALNIFTNYDGSGSSFGNTIVSAKTDNTLNSSVYAAINNASDDVLRIILTNKNYDKPQVVNISVESTKNYADMEVYSLDSTDNSIIQNDGTATIVDNTLSYTLEPLSIVELVLRSDQLNQPDPSIQMSDVTSNDTTIPTSFDFISASNQESSGIIDTTKDTTTVPSSKTQEATDGLVFTTDESSDETTPGDTLVNTLSNTSITSKVSTTKPVDSVPPAVKISVIFLICVMIAGVAYLFLGNKLFRK